MSTGLRRSSRQCHSAPESISSTHLRSPILSSRTGPSRRPRWQAILQCVRRSPPPFRCSHHRCMMRWARWAQLRFLRVSQLPWRHCREYPFFSLLAFYKDDLPNRTTKPISCLVSSFTTSAKEFAQNLNLLYKMMMRSMLSRSPALRL